MIKRLFLSEGFVLLLILINALLIFISGYDFGNSFNSLFFLIDSFITLLFVIEMGVKLQVNKLSFFKSKWNVFDFALILLSLPSLLTFVFGLELKGVDFILIFRVLRVFKSFRFIRFIPSINHLIAGINRALKASLVIIFGFSLYIFIVGVLSYYLFNECCPKYFETPLLSLYSVFKIFTIEGWFEIPELVTSSLSSLSSFFVYLYFIFIVMSGGVFGLSLVNSIFVDAMVSDNNDVLEKKVDSLEKKIDTLLEQLTKQ